MTEKEEEKHSEEQFSHPQWRLAKWFPHIDEPTLNLLEKFHVELLRFNKATNLISPKTEREADLHHFADSVIGGEIILRNCPQADRFYDIGSGNGFPGLVMAILAPETEFVLVDSDGRKVEFLRHMVSTLSLKNVKPMNIRIEDLEPGEVKYAVSRAFAPLQKAMRICRSLVCEKGIYYHFKSDSWGTEVLKTPVQVGRFWEPSVVGNYNLPGVRIKLAIVALERIV